jgi:hypothetical protein
VYGKVYSSYFPSGDIPAPERPTKKQTFDEEVEGKITYFPCLSSLIVNPGPSDMQMLWNKTWNRNEEAIPRFTVYPQEN